MSRYFTEDHEWVDVDGDTGTVGITDYAQGQLGDIVFVDVPDEGKTRSEEHTSELQSLMRISYAVFCLKKKKQNNYKERPINKCNNHITVHNIRIGNQV